MHIAQEDVPALEKWLTGKVRDNSDVDPAVLVEYIIELLRSNSPEASLKAEIAENLREFVKGDVVTSLVDDIFKALRSQSYKPQVASRSNLRPAAPAFNPPTRPVHSITEPSTTSSRKRSRQDFDNEDNRSNFNRSNNDFRSHKRRSNPQPQYIQQPLPIPSMAHVPPPPQFLPNPPVPPPNPAEFMMMLQAMQAGFPPPPIPPTSSLSKTSKATGQRCRDYDTKGFCARGSSCPYDHGADRIEVPSGPSADANNPFAEFMNNPLFRTMLSMTGNMSDMPSQQRPHRRDNHRQQRKRRSSFSETGISNDPSNSTLVVENIPSNYLSEQAIKDFFENFGPVEEITLQAYRHLAIVKFSTRKGAIAAYESPDVVFQNRFVKIFWYKTAKHGSLSRSNGDTSHANGKEDSPPIDPEELQRKIDEAQKVHEAKSKLLQEAKAKQEDLDRRAQELADRRHTLNVAIAAKQGKPIPEAEDEILKAKLAALEAEAESLGLDPSLEVGNTGIPSARYSSFRGRGGARGRGFTARGRGDSSYRGAFGYRGRGHAAGGAVMRLDNRPKKVVVGIAPGSSEDETMRQWIMNNWEVDSIDTHPEKEDQQVISFKERYMAESFIAQAASTLGQVALSWFTGSLPKTTAPTISRDQEENEADNDQDVPMSETKAETAVQKPKVMVERDLDEADDDDWR